MGHPHDDSADCTRTHRSAGALRLRNRMLALLLGVASCGAFAAPVAAGEALARARNCLACHKVERKVVGPAFKAVAARYAGKPDMVEPLARKIRQGGGGVWGPVPMPAHPQVSEADARALASWVLGLR